MQHLRPCRTVRAALGLATLAAALLPGHARAQVAVNITPTVTAAGSQNSYSYRLQDTGTSSIGKFDLSVPTSAALSNTTSPAGWLALYTTGDPFIEWDSTDSLTDIAPTASLSGFSFTSPFPAGPQIYQVTSFDDFSTAGGTTRGPVVPAAIVTPEASGLANMSGALLALALGGLVMAVKKKKANMSGKML